MFTHQLMISNQLGILDILVIKWVLPSYMGGGGGYYGYQGAGPSGYLNGSFPRYLSGVAPYGGLPADGAYG